MGILATLKCKTCQVDFSLMNIQANDVHLTGLVLTWQHYLKEGKRQT
jgi:hypothetical protein